MNCSEVKELLSAYCDAELPVDMRSAMAKHLGQCDECSNELSGFEQLSAATLLCDMPAPPAHIWTQLEEQLSEVESTVQPTNDQARSLRFRRWLHPMPQLVTTCAATILVAIGVSWIGYTAWFAPRAHKEFTVAFGHYLGEFRRDPAAAQQFVLTKFQGQVVDAQQAMHRVGYRPAVANGLPDDYAVESTCVMEMPHCTCVQCSCKRSDGSTIAIFEHDDEQSKQWFGDRPAVTATCNGKQCTLVELDGRMAATWKHENRYITVIGVRDVVDVNQLVAWFDDR